MNDNNLLIRDIKNRFFWAILVRYAITGIVLIIFSLAIFLKMDVRAGLYFLAFIAAYNLLAHIIYLFKKNYELWQLLLLSAIFLVFDVSAVTFLIYITGWIESPYWFLYLVLIVISGFGVYSYYSFSVFIIALFSAAFYLGLLWAFYAGLLPVYRPDLKLTPQEMLVSISNKALFTTIAFFLFAATIYYFSKLLSEHRRELLNKNQELLSALQELKEIDRLKDEFVSTASHELRTPLSLIRENISLVEDGIVGAVSAQQKGRLASSRNSVDRLSKILDDLLDLSKIERRFFDVDLKRIDISRLAEKAIHFIRPKADEKKIQIETKLQRGLIALLDPDKIFRVFIILLDNAIKYNYEKGRILVGVEDMGEWIRCYVGDTGIGIAEKDVPRIFRPFVRVGNEVGGTGLGLSICRGIIELHGGKIQVESKLKEGSKFIFILPKGEKNDTHPRD